MSKDEKTAEAFATSWNNLPEGSVYSKEQFEEWLRPIEKDTVAGKKVLELGCGNGSLLVHMINWKPEKVLGVDLGDSVKSAQANLNLANAKNFEIVKNDLVEFESEGFDFVYCIGVLHHLKDPLSGFKSVIRNTKDGGKFHCWVYAKEGNLIIRLLVEPIRKFASKLPWWFTKFLIATPLSFCYFLYAHMIVSLKLSFMPLFKYSKWICKRNFSFFRHVAFDQLVTPQTEFIPRTTIEKWLESFEEIDQNSTYIIFRNGNSWKFGGEKYKKEDL